MKKVLLQIIFFIAFPSQLICQWSVSFNGGYNFKWASNDIPDGNIMELDSGARNIEVFKHSYGAGMTYTLTVSRRISNFLFAECQISYFDGSTSTRTVDLNTTKLSESYSGKILWLSPGIKLMPNDEKKISPFARVALNIGVLGELNIDRNIQEPQSLSERTILYSKGVAYGLSSSLGLVYRSSIKSKWEFFSEIQFRSSSYSPNQSERIKDIENGENILPSLTVNATTVIYKSEYVRNPNDPVDLSKPTIANRRYYPFSSLGLNLGIAYKF